MRRISILLLLIALFSCSNEPGQKVNEKKVDNKALGQSLEKANRYLVAEEEEEIDNYVRRHNLDMTETGTGLRYQIVKEGEGRQIGRGDLVTLQYDLFSITDDLIYSSKTEGEKKFVVASGEAETGLHELMPLLKVGSVVKAILPSHLAYGLTGDQQQIKQRNTLIYHIKVVSAE